MVLTAYYDHLRYSYSPNLFLQPFSLQVKRIASYPFYQTSKMVTRRNTIERGSSECRVEELQGIWSQHGSINVLSDDVLLEIFDSYRHISGETSDNFWKWDTLTHVCRRWRNIVLGSPRRLDLCLLCTYGTPVRRMLDYWPSLPIVIKYSATLEFKPPSPEDEDSVIAALEHPSRIRQVQLAITSELLEKVAPLMEMPLPELTSLSLWSDQGYSNCTAPAIHLPDTFLGGCAPRLRTLSLIGISFPNLPRLLSSSARGLASLRLLEVPEAGYIAPDMMAACLATLTNLRVLHIEFRSPKCGPPFHSREIPPPALKRRAILPTLTCFNFRGTSAYLEDLLARIEAPVLNNVHVTFFNQLVFEVPQFSQFIGRMETLKSAKVAEMESSFGSGVSLKLDRSSASATPSTDFAVGEHHPLSLCVSCGVLDWQISSMAQICSQSHLLSGVRHLYIRADYLHLGYQWQEDMDSIAWLELFNSFTSVETLNISGELCPHVAPALEMVTTLEMQLMPGLRVLHFECCRKSAVVEKFVAAREGFNCPVKVQHASFPPWGLWDNVQVSY